MAQGIPAGCTNPLPQNDPDLRNRDHEGHVRLRREGPPAHTITVPRRNSLKTGTLHGILLEVAEARIGGSLNEGHGCMAAA